MTEQQLAILDKNASHGLPPMLSPSVGFLNPTTLEAALKAADLISKSSLCPKDYKDKPADILICMQMGQELGVPILQALQGIAVINGRPAVWGDLMLALCRRATAFEYCDETYDADTQTATCKTKRKNEPPIIRTFSRIDAETAKLWGKQGSWTTNPLRMLQMRARAFALRDGFADVLKGLSSAEEAFDIEPTDYSIMNDDQPLFTKQSLSDIVTSEQVQILRDKLKECNRDETAVCTHLKLDCLESMRLVDWNEMVRILDAAIIKKLRAANAPINQAMKTRTEQPETIIDDLEL